MQEEIMLQSPLHKRLHESKEFVLNLEHRNGRKMLVVIPPDTSTVAKFQEEAKRTGWVDKLLNDNHKVEGMLSHLAVNKSDSFEAIAKKKRAITKPVIMDTTQTMAMARVGKLNDVNLKNVRNFARKSGNVTMQHSTKEIQRMDEQVGLDRTKKDITFGNMAHEWSKTKGKEKKEPEEIHCWNASLMNEIEAEVDLCLAHFAKDKQLKEFPTVSYIGDGFDEGVTVSIGGDHGDKNCPMSAKLNLSPPAERKRLGKLNYRCPIVQFASVKCSKDAHDLLDKTIMPKTQEEITELQQSALVTVCDKDNFKSHRSYKVPVSIRQNTMAVASDGATKRLVFAHDSDNDNGFLACGEVALDDNRRKDIPHFRLGFEATVKKFNDLCVGDLAFLCMPIGMRNSDGDHCPMCLSKGSEFNCSSHENLTARTREKLDDCLEKHKELLETKKNNKNQPRNYKGANCEGLLRIDPQRIVIPMLHCPMGLVDKVLESFKMWASMELEKCGDAELESARSVFRLADSSFTKAEKTHDATKEQKKATPNNAEVKRLEGEADQVRKNAKKNRRAAKEKHDESLKTHNAKKRSLSQQFENVYRRNGVKREHYHGGKFNGVDCMRIMDEAEKTFLEVDSLLTACLKSKVDATSEQEVRAKLEECARLLDLLDAIWSKARGIDSGLPPTPKQKEELARAIKKGKQKWIDLGIGALQPKWHLTFDGHLEEQFDNFQGLADKADDSIEHFHQALKELRTRFRSIASYETQENCIRRELRRKKSPEIQAHIDAFEAKGKQSNETKRKQDAMESRNNKREAKRVKREAAVA